MRQRCFDPKHKNYALYGGRGITVCERWLTFENFYADMGPRPTPKHTIDRFPDKDGPYAPDNCRWATWTEQQNNRSNNRHVLVNGERLTIAQAARALGVTVKVIRGRIDRGELQELQRHHAV